MNDHFSIIPIDRLLKLILSQLDSNGPVLGLSPQLFFQSKDKESIQAERYGQKLETPIGVAAGPHTQLSQNIVAAWLCGARFIELKTIQTLDELSISKPCIDMQDEGYNCEWSQELKIRDSFDQYLNAWLIIHILNHKLFGKAKGDPGVIFNMSVGYDFQGIQKDNVQWYLDQMKDASGQMDQKIQELRQLYPEVEKLEINPQLSDNITLSTMHGCPPNEIESIASYLIEERGLHTSIKLNPTLLGPEKLHEILLSSGFKTVVPDQAFEHDLKYAEAKAMITRLTKKAKEKNLHFGLKLTNTLESSNHKEVFGDEPMMYMSGRALHPIAVNLAARLQNDFDGTLNISFSGGANADNISDLIQSGLAPVTICSDLLKPGGYGRLAQYIEKLRENQANKNKQGAHQYLQEYALRTLEQKAYKRSQIADPELKTDRPLGYFDCIQAPCVSTCPTHQDIPNYLHFAAEGEVDKAYQVIRDTNPFPLTTGMICDHLCQTKCVRIHYDSPLLIREVKRFVAEYGSKLPAKALQQAKNNGKKAAIIGAGPSGLSCAYFLAQGGMKVEIFEEKEDPGGMISHAIPAFRLSDEAMQMDIDRIREMGVEIHYKQKVDTATFEKLRKDFDYLYIGAGAQKSARLKLGNMDAKGILDPLDFLFDLKAGSRPDLGKHIVIIGGGNTAMDAARSVWRLVDEEARITIVYRRTLQQMPADHGEIQAVLAEGIHIKELVNPVEIITEKGQIKALKCQKMILGEKDKSGRPKPLPLENEFLEIPVDTLIPAIGQVRDFDFNLSVHTLKKGSYQSDVKGVFLGGDALRGASTAINAIGDGRKAAAEILEEAGKSEGREKLPQRQASRPEELMIKKARREQSIAREVETDPARTFDVLSKSLSEEEVQREAARCLKCDELCNLCVTVCPNLAFHSFSVQAKSYPVQKVEKRKNAFQIDHLYDLEIQQEQQILHVADWCNQCGNCTTFCPSSGSPYLDKAHLYLDKAAFHQEKDGFHLEEENGTRIIYGYREHELFSLTEYPDAFDYKCPGGQLTLSKEDLGILQIQYLEEERHADTAMAVTLSLILQGSIDFIKC
jgi:putative selenate reductase